MRRRLRDAIALHALRRQVADLDDGKHTGDAARSAPQAGPQVRRAHHVHAAQHRLPKTELRPNPLEHLEQAAGAAARTGEDAAQRRRVELADHVAERLPAVAAVDERIVQRHHKGNLAHRNALQPRDLCEACRANRGFRGGRGRDTPKRGGEGRTCGSTRVVAGATGRTSTRDAHVRGSFRRHPGRAAEFVQRLVELAQFGRLVERGVLAGDVWPPENQRVAHPAKPRDAADRVGERRRDGRMRLRVWPRRGCTTRGRPHAGRPGRAADVHLVHLDADAPHELQRVRPRLDLLPGIGLQRDDETPGLQQRGLEQPHIPGTSAGVMAPR